MRSLSQGVDPDVALDYLWFVEERHRIWTRRQAGHSGQWTADPIMSRRKFTNVFRILDPGTQFIMTDLLVEDPREQLMLLFLYRHTGRSEFWRTMILLYGVPEVSTLGAHYHLWVAHRDAGNPVFTGAYLVYPQSSTPGTDKLMSIFELTARLFNHRSPDDIVPDFLAARTQEARFETLRRNKGVAEFMSMQILTDWGYTPHCGADLENDFVVAGPGATRGANALRTGKTRDTITWARDAVLASPSCPTLLQGSVERVPSLMDVQNTLCELSKYLRWQGKPAGSVYTPAHPGPQPEPALPEHW